MGGVYIGGGALLVILIIVLIVVLLFRPSGIMGERVAERA